MTLGLDYAWERPDPQALWAAGYHFAIRYLSRDTTGKNLTAAEAQTLRAAGLSIVLNWEYVANAALGGFIQGHDDAVEAATQRAQVGAPNTVPVYFSVDFNASQAQMPTVMSYLAGCVNVLGHDGVGVYGSFAVVQRAMDANVCRWAWQTYAWSNGAWDQRAQLRQIRNGVPFNGVSIDQDESTTVDFGQWSVGRVDGMPFILSIIDTDGKNYDGLADGVGGWHYVPVIDALAEVEAMLGPNMVRRTVSRQMAIDAYGVDLGNHPTLADVVTDVKAVQQVATTEHVSGTLTVGP